MDGRRFDRFVASLGQTTTRRQWLKTCASGLIATALGLDADRARAFQIQPATTPLPNFPFLAVVPTDTHFTGYAIDKQLNGPPTRFRSLAAMKALSDAGRTAIGDGFQSAYTATVSLPKSTDPKAAQRSITTAIFDLGSEQAATDAHKNYTAMLFSDPSISPLSGGTSPNKQIVLGGCLGGCRSLSSPTLNSQGSTNEVAIVGQRGQFLFDARLRSFDNSAIDVSDANAVAGLIDSRLTSVISLTTGAPSASSRGAAVRLLAAPIQTARSAYRLLAAADDLRNALASRNTLPIFQVDQSSSPPVTATQTLVVDKGAIVVNFGETAVSAAARQRSAEDVVFACATEHPLTFPDGFPTGYHVSLSSVQYVFGSENDAIEFVAETRERLKRDRPHIKLTKVSTTADEVSDMIQDGRASQGLSYGCHLHQVIRLGANTAVLAVEISAQPNAANLPPVAAADIANKICPTVNDAAAKFTACILTPDKCHSTLMLQAPDTQPTPTPAPACAAPNTICAGVCVDITTDPNHCGNCQNVCPQGLSCVFGNCQCPNGQYECNGACIDLLNDLDNCGSCGIICSQDAKCTNGVCTCSDGTQQCGSVCCNPGDNCVNGTCTGGCDSGLSYCGSVCVDLSSDPNNCGDCTVACDTGICCSGSCTYLGSDPNNCSACGMCCDTGFCCGGSCVDGSSDSSNCGGCGVTCGDSSCCSGSCVDPVNDPQNCGACGNDCGGGGCCDGQCTDTSSDSSNCGGCGVFCDATCCAGSCVDMLSDPNNCGACGNVCGSNQACYTGSCGDISG
jgi:hypothetical protein